MLIVKISGSVLTKRIGYMELNEENLLKTAQTIANVWKRRKKMIIVIGSGAYGQAPILKYGVLGKIKTNEEMLGFAETHVACCELALTFSHVLIEEGVPAVPVSPFPLVTVENRKIKKMDEKLIIDLVKKGYLPILYEDMVPDKKLGGSLIDEDELVLQLGKKAKKVVMGISVDGIIADGKLIEKINQKNIKELENKSVFFGEEAGDKLIERLKSFLKLKKPIIFVHAVKQKRLEEAMLGKKTYCTELKG